MKQPRPILVAITGGSGAGKTWLTARLLQIFGARATQISLDSFYRDRSHLPLKRRESVNYDHPRAIDWLTLEECLGALRAGRPAKVPQYDFATHSRMPGVTTISPRPLVIVEGLWLLRRPTLRKLFDFTIFVDCSASLRLTRRIQRDQAERGRSANSVRRQFRATVAPMHNRFIAPQARHAGFVCDQPLTELGVMQIAKSIGQLLGGAPSHSPES